MSEEHNCEGAKFCQLCALGDIERLKAENAALRRADDALAQVLRAEVERLEKADKGVQAWARLYEKLQNRARALETALEQYAPNHPLLEMEADDA